MPALRELQAAFGRAMLGAHPDAALLAGIAGDGMVAAARLACYRHHVAATLAAVLREAYPVVTRLVDERFFAYAADQFVRAHPPAGPCLFEFGARFPAFLAQFPPTRPLGYLPDVARLEWALHAAHHAEDPPPVPLPALAGAGGAGWPFAVLRLHPALAFVQSRWPVHRIWAANQPDAGGDGAVDLGAGGVRLVVERDGLRAAFRELPVADWALRRALAAGRPLADAVLAALEVDGDLDVTCALRALFEDGCVVDVTLNP